MTETLGFCAGCGAHRLVREFDGIKVCVDRCWPRRRAIRNAPKKGKK